MIEEFVSFEHEPPSIDEMTDRLTGITEAGYPYLVAETKGELAGYCYASSYRPRPAYGKTVESTVYVAPKFWLYNLGLLRQHLKQDSDAEASLLKAQELEPDNLDYLYALADFYLKRRQLQKARRIAEEMVARHPTQRIGHDILQLIEKNIRANSN